MSTILTQSKPFFIKWQSVVMKPDCESYKQIIKYIPF